MAQGFRPQRVADQIREELSSMLTRGEVHDPHVGFITLTRVQVSADLQVAHVYYTSLGDQAARTATQKALDRATPFLRRQIGSRVNLRRVPELSFRFDESIGHQDRIEQILKDLHQEEAARAASAPTTEANTEASTEGSADATKPSDRTNDHDLD